MSPNTPPRINGLDYVGPRRYFVTTCTFRRLNWLADKHQPRHIAAQVSPFFEARGFAVLAYCLMPDHVHLLLEGVLETANLASGPTLETADGFRLEAPHGRASLAGRLPRPGVTRLRRCRVRGQVHPREPCSSRSRVVRDGVCVDGIVPLRHRGAAGARRPVEAGMESAIAHGGGLKTALYMHWLTGPYDHGASVSV